MCSKKICIKLFAISQKNSVIKFTYIPLLDEENEQALQYFFVLIPHSTLIC